jgi:D-beta-D-heptose 7-phosphate kinase/D-beta-D-heptose 1-phosphate adenosyltransferase
VTVSRRTFVPGGAGNVAANVVSLGGSAFLGSIIGSDLAADTLRTTLSGLGVGLEGLLADPGRPTTTKTRIVARGQQVVRVDTEEKESIDPVVEVALVNWAESAVRGMDACVVSDYLKGVLTDRVTRSVIAAARAARIPVVVDPKGRAYDRYSGATVVTPNTHEAAHASGLDVDGAAGLAEAARHLQHLLGGSAVLVTRGADGMSLFEAGSDPVHIPTAAQEVYDVTGAGDTVTSTLALALAGGHSLPDAARLATYAASLVVAKVGTATITQEELLQALPENPREHPLS